MLMRELYLKYWNKKNSKCNSFMDIEIQILRMAVRQIEEEV